MKNEKLQICVFCLCHFLYICGGDSNAKRQHTERCFGCWCSTGMSRASHYRAQADLARRLAEITVQPNLERELRYVAEELDHLANEIASDNTDFLRS
jgi:hypothetical protein